MNKQSRTPRGSATLRPRSNPAPPPSAEVPASVNPPPLRGDPNAVARWLDAARAAVLGIAAAAREGARRPRKRVLSRAEICRQARDGLAQATALLDLAAEALRPSG